MRPGRSGLTLPASPCPPTAAESGPAVTPWTTLDPTAASKVDGSGVEEAAPVADEGTVYTFTLDTTNVVIDPAAMLRYQATVDLDWTAFTVVEIELDAPEHDAKDVVGAFLAADGGLEAGIWLGVSRESGSVYDNWIRSTDVNVPNVGGPAGPLKIRAALVCNGDGRIHGSIEVYDRATGAWLARWDHDVNDAGLTGSTAVIGVCLGRRSLAGETGHQVKAGVRYRLH